jgi:hypothetical protein
MSAPTGSSPLWQRTWVLRGLGIGLVLGSAATLWLAYTATYQWRQNTELLLERKTEEELTLAHTSVIRDMRGAQAAMLTVPREQLLDPAPHDLMQTCARIFAKYPYPESVFSWRPDEAGLPIVLVFDRADRPPPWRVNPGATRSFPVQPHTEAGKLLWVVDAVLEYAIHRKHIAVFETLVEGVPYQIVARLE